MNIYEKLKKPIISLSPMEDVTDTVFRQIVLSLGRPDLFYTEFVNVQGLNGKGRERVIHRLKYVGEEKPIIAQLWGADSKSFYEASKLISSMGFDGIDINMGCSVKNVVKSNAGSGLINVERKIVEDIIQGTKDGSKGLPVSVKTRLGWESVDLQWIGFLLEQSLDVLTIHMRTARGIGAIKADWSYMNEIVKLRDGIAPNTLIFGNGDVHSLKEANGLVESYGIDGVMIGRESISNPWVFTGRENISNEERLKVFKKHMLLYDQVWGNEKDFHGLKKFFRAYINGYEGATELRSLRMQSDSVDQVLEILENY